VLAFRTSVLWGVLVLLVPCAAIVFAIMNWAEARKPFLIYICGAVVQIAALPLGFMGAAREVQVTTPTSPVASVRPDAPATVPSPAPEPVTPRVRNLEAPAPAPAHKPGERATPDAQTIAPLPTPRPKQPEPELATNAPAGPAPPAAEKKPVLDFSGFDEPVTVNVARFTRDESRLLNRLVLNLTNQANQVVTEVKMKLTYLDKRGRRLMEWPTFHTVPEGIVGPKAATQFEFPAFGMPRDASRVIVTVQRVQFAGGFEWEVGK
jgi:hypothetical protein